MRSAREAEEQIARLKSSGIPLSEAAWKAALLCTGWPYIFGDRGSYCTPSHRRAAYASHGDAHPTIKSKCQNFEGGGTCSGCAFYPGGQTRAFDCRGFTYWILLQVFGWKLIGAGATSQWNTESNWKAKGLVKDGIPQGTIVCLFYHKKGSSTVMAHTGLYYNGETCECSAGVQHFTKPDKKWTHWAIPACVEEAVPEPTPVPDPEPGSDRPTLRRGSKGDDVKDLQLRLHWKGYDLGSYGVDGDYGRATEAAVKAFQTDAGLKADGICGPDTWRALLGEDNGEDKPKTYTVRITGVSEAEKTRLLEEFPAATVERE